MQSNTTQQVLLEVRKAYRLLYQYQRRILDLMKYIGNAYQLSYEGGYTKFSAVSPRNGKGNLTNTWAWDWLSMYYYEFHFKEKKAKADIIYFSVFLVNDTGYFEANKLEAISQTTLSKYHPVDKSETKLIFVAGKNLWEGWSYDWKDSLFVLEKEGYKQNDKGIMIFKSYSLEGFFEEVEAEVNLKDFQVYCQANNIEIKFSPKKI